MTSNFATIDLSLALSHLRHAGYSGFDIRCYERDIYVTVSHWDEETSKTIRHQIVSPPGGVLAAANALPTVAETTRPWLERSTRERHPSWRVPSDRIRG